MPMRAWLLLSAFALACSSSAGSSKQLPTTPKEAAMKYLDAVLAGRCRDAYGIVGGALRDSYEKMVEARGLEFACQTWKEGLIPAEYAEYAFEETETEQIIVWARLHKNKFEYSPIGVRVKQAGPVWQVVGL